MTCSRIFLHVLCWLLLSWLLCAEDEAKINIGIVTSNEEEVAELNLEILNNHISTKSDVTIQTLKMPENDCFTSANALCKAASQDNGLTAILGTETSDDTLKSVSDFLGVPYIETVWSPRGSKQFETSFSIYPEASLLSQAYGAIVESLDLKTFAVVYENEESLVKMQDVLKLQEFQADSKKNSIILKKLDESGDSRRIFKEIRSTPVFSIVLDCSTDKIIDVLLQAKDVMLLDDLNTNIFLTSFDAHTLDYTILDTLTNITTVRLFDPSSRIVEDYVSKTYPDNSANQLTVKMALVHDAMLLLAESLNAIKSAHADGEIVYEPLFCNASEKYSDKYGLVSAMQEVTLTGITGEVTLRAGKRENFDLQIVELSMIQEPVIIGLWYASEPNQVERTRSATEREREWRDRLSMKKFIVTSRIGEPYLRLSKNPDAEGNARYEGFSMDLIDTIAKELGITYEFQITEDNLYPNLQKDLMSRKADLAICDYTITPQRQEAIDFSLPFMSLGIGILHKAEQVEQEANLYGFLGPLSATVWMYIGALYLFMSLILVIIVRMSGEDWENPHPCDENPSELENIWDFKNCLWLTLGSITTQGCDILPKGVCSRIATASWWFFSLIITATYTANLAAFLTMSKKDDSIKSVEELAAQSKVKYGCLRNGATASFFEHSNNSLYQRMWNTMINEKPSVFEDSNVKGVERVMSTKNELYAFFIESTGIDYELERKCDLRRIGDLLDSKSYGIGMPLNSGYRNDINRVLLQLQEKGELGKLKEKWWKEEREGDPCPTIVPGNSDALALENVGGVFIVLIAGIGIAFLIAILEFLWNVHNVSVEEHISYFEALRVELKFACNITVTKKRAKPLLSESSSSKSVIPDDAKSNKGILLGAGSVLNISASILNRMGSTLGPEDASMKQVKSQSGSSKSKHSR
ncbi:glutamate receptor ionotropic, kainate 2-like [Euwallacea similis]|uniref:glutamate receptor ionotropic, kainate 2-like n=1 Tax=Euwallacea similis TaxID=1736056 RepID=UPI00344F04C7